MAISEPAMTISHGKSERVSEPDWRKFMATPAHDGRWNVSAELYRHVRPWQAAPAAINLIVR